MISDNHIEKNVNFLDYLKALMPLLFGKPDLQAQFIFKLYDKDGDGKLQGADIVELL